MHNNPALQLKLFSGIRRCDLSMATNTPTTAPNTVGIPEVESSLA